MPDNPDKAAFTATARALRPPEHGVEKRAIFWWALQGLLVSAPPLAAAIVAFVFWEGARPWLVVALVGAVLFFVSSVLVEPLWRYSVHRWETTEHAVYARSGWLVREWRAAPLSRIQTVDAIQGPVEQILGLATLKVTTASSGGAIDIGGLDKATANKVAEILTQVAQLTPGDAT